MKITHTYNMTIAQAEKIHNILGKTPIEGPDDYRIAFYDDLGEMIYECYDWKGIIDFPLTGTKKSHKFFNNIYEEVLKNTTN